MRSSLEDGNRGIRGINPMASTELVNKLYLSKNGLPDPCQCCRYSSGERTPIFRALEASVSALLPTKTTKKRPSGPGFAVTASTYQSFAKERHWSGVPCVQPRAKWY